MNANHTNTVNRVQVAVEELVQRPVEVSYGAKPSS
jgi:hypothetical protein